MCVLPAAAQPLWETAEAIDQVDLSSPERSGKALIALIRQANALTSRCIQQLATKVAEELAPWGQETMAEKYPTHGSRIALYVEIVGACAGRLASAALLACTDAVDS